LLLIEPFWDYLNPSWFTKAFRWIINDSESLYDKEDKYYGEKLVSSCIFYSLTINLTKSCLSLEGYNPLVYS